MGVRFDKYPDAVAPQDHEAWTFEFPAIDFITVDERFHDGLNLRVLNPVAEMNLATIFVRKHGIDTFQLCRRLAVFRIGR